MTQQEIQNFLEEHPGYIAWGKGKLADKFGVSEEVIKEVKKRIANNIKETVEEEETTTTYQLDSGVNVKLPNILILDIETAPIRAYVWRLWKQDVYLDQIISDFFVISWAAKWLYDDSIYSAVLTSEEILEEDDSTIMGELWHMLNKADIVVAHNGNSFDIPKIKARFAIHGMAPTSFYQQIDTKVIAAKEFGFSSNKLDALARNFNIGSKIHTEFDLWARCMKGDEDALTEMETYNKHDVEILEEVYLKLRPYIKNHPNVTLYDDNISSDRCTSCGSDHLVADGHYFTSTGKFPVYRCEECGSLVRGRKAIKRAINVSNLSLGR
jgi:hypothetical protein